MARFEASTVGTGVVQSATGDVQASQPFTIAGGPLYAAETGGTTLSGGSLITNASGELPGWLDPDTDPGIYTLTIGAKVKKFQVGVGIVKRTQVAESTNTPVFEVVPATAGFAPFHVQAQSYANTGAGAGTYNHITAFGYNAARSTGGSATAGKPGVYMGFEDNYYDDGGDATYGPEWYTGYTTPDGTTIKHAGLRPLYWRVKAGDTNTTDKNVLVNIDLGDGVGGALSVGNFGTFVSGLPTTFREIFIVSRSAIYHRQTAWCTANSPGGSGTLKVAPLSGYAQLDIVAPGTGTAGTFGIIAFKDTATAVWNLTATTGEFYVEDQVNGPRKQMSMVPGASNTAATTTFNSTVKVMGNIGFYGATPGAKPAPSGSRGGNAALASLLTSLAGMGLITDSTTA